MISLLGLGFCNTLSKKACQWSRLYTTLSRFKVNTFIPNCPAVERLSTSTSQRASTQQSSSRREERFKIKDGVPQDYELVYKAPMESYVTVAQGFSILSLATLGSVGVYQLFQGSGELLPNRMIENSEQMLIAIAILVLANVSMLSIAFRYPLRIYNRKNEYKSIFTGLFPTQTRIIEFKSRDVKRVESNSILPWRNSIFKIDQKNVFLFDHCFRKPVDFSRMIDGENNSKVGHN